MADELRASTMNLEELQKTTGTLMQIGFKGTWVPGDADEQRRGATIFWLISG